MRRPGVAMSVSGRKIVPASVPGRDDGRVGGAEAADVEEFVDGAEEVERPVPAADVEGGHQTDRAGQDRPVAAAGQEEKARRHVAPADHAQDPPPRRLKRRHPAVLALAPEDEDEDDKGDRRGDLQAEEEALLFRRGPSRHDSPEPEHGQRGQKIPEIFAQAGRRRRKAVLVDEEDAQKKEGQRPHQHVPDQRGGGPAFGPPLCQRERDGDADDEQEAGEDDVGQGEDVLVRSGVPEDEGDGRHAGDVVDEDHRQDVEAAKGVEAGQPLFHRGRGGCRRRGSLRHPRPPSRAARMPRT